MNDLSNARVNIRKGSKPREGMRTLLLTAMTAFPPMAIDQYLPALPTISQDLHALAAGGEQ